MSSFVDGLLHSEFSGLDYIYYAVCLVLIFLVIFVCWGWYELKAGIKKNHKAEEKADLSKWLD